jgi:hypothetical protein
VPARLVLYSRCENKSTGSQSKVHINVQTVSKIRSFVDGFSCTTGHSNKFCGHKASWILNALQQRLYMMLQVAGIA